MRVAVIGTGNIGRTLGGALARAGHEVAFGSRSPQEDATGAGGAGGRDAGGGDAGGRGETARGAAATLTSVGQAVAGR